MTLPLISWIAIGVSFGVIFVTVRSMARGWRLTLRRESALTQIVAAQSALVHEWAHNGTDLESPLLTECMRVHLACADEIVCQDTVRSWQRIPPPGEPWPDSFPRAEIL